MISSTLQKRWVGQRSHSPRPPHGLSCCATPPPPSNTTIDTGNRSNPHIERFRSFIKLICFTTITAHQVDQGQRNQHLPGQAHELVEAEARHRPADQHVEQDEERQLSPHITSSLRITANQPGPSGRPGKCQPPKNRTTIRKLVVIMCVYSPRKNRPNFSALYSVW